MILEKIKEANDVKQLSLSECGGMHRKSVIF